jgi:uncharacterized protein
VFKDSVQTLQDLEPGMRLEGVVTNVANFGAFVDIGVHQDGLVHVSQLADRFIKDPREVVKAGDIVTVKVVEVDLKRRRIALTMKLQDAGEGQRRVAPTGVEARGAKPAGNAARSGKPTANVAGGARPAPPAQAPGRQDATPPAAPNTSIAAAFAKLAPSRSRK